MQRFVGYLGLALSIVVLATGCQKNAPPSAAGTTSANPPARIGVSLVSLQKKTLRWTIEQPGIVQAYEATPLVAKLPGYVAKVHVDINDPIVGPGEAKPQTVLAEISMPEVEEEVKQKQAVARQAKAETEVAEKNVAAAEAMVTSAQKQVVEAMAREKGARASFERWKGESQRLAELAKERVIDKQTVEETRNQMVVAEGAFDEAKAHSGGIEAKHVEAQAKRDVALAERRAAEARFVAATADAKRVAALLEYSQIKAPYSGVVTGRFVHTGHFLQNGGKAEAMFTVARIDRVRVVVDVPEADAARIEAKMKARVRIAAQNREFAGDEIVVSRTSWALNPEFKSLRVEVDLPNGQGSLRPGMFAQVTFALEQADAVTVPSAAITYVDDATFCWLAIDGKAVRHQIRPGRTDQGAVEIHMIRRAVANQPWRTPSSADQFITAPSSPLADGAAIEVRKQ